MEVFYLLCSLLSTSITSFALSLLLPFRLLFRPFAFWFIAGEDSVSLYEGTVWHERRRPVHHSFRYPVRYALIDLDHASNPPPDHLSAHEARRISGTTGPVFLLTIPPSVGYVQNPLSLYYCYDTDGSLQNLKKCIAEVTNTPWGERVSFLFNPNSDVVAKALHVSPFMALKLWWKGAPFLQHPRYYNPRYRGEAVLSDEKLQCCPAFVFKTKNNQPAGEHCSNPAVHPTPKHHCFTWRNAKWPWC